jgi:maltooligosyltrehalose synthase
VLNPKATPPSGKVTMAGKRFQVGSKVFLKKTGIPGIIRENQGSKTWKIELVDPNNGKPNSIYKDSVKSSDIRNLKEDEFPRSSEESAEQQQQQQKTKKKQTKKKDADESKEEEETEAFKEPKIKWTKSKARALLYQDIQRHL